MPISTLVKSTPAMAVTDMRSRYPRLPSSQYGIQALMTVAMLSQITAAGSLSSWNPNRRISPAMRTAMTREAAIRARIRPREPFAIRLSNQYWMRFFKEKPSFFFFFISFLREASGNPPRIRSKPFDPLYQISTENARAAQAKKPPPGTEVFHAGGGNYGVRIGSAARGTGSASAYSKSFVTFS